MSILPQINYKHHYTYGDYMKFPEDERWEIFQGQTFAMSPAPTWGHQKLAGIIFNKLYMFLKEKPCEPFIAPVDVFLPKPDENIE